MLDTSHVCSMQGHKFFNASGYSNLHFIACSTCGEVRSILMTKEVSTPEPEPEVANVKRES